MAEREADTRRAIRDFLARYPVTFSFGQGGQHPFVQIETQDRRTKKIHFSGSRGSRFSRIRVQADLHRALKTLDVRPWPEERREARIGGLGTALIEAATAADPLVIPEPEEATMATLTLPEKTNGHRAPAAASTPEPSRQPTEYTKLRQHEVVQITVLITSNARIDYTARSVDYAEGWSDSRLLDMLRAAPGRELLTLDHIVNFRRENFGLIASERELPAPPEGRSVGGHVIQMRKKIASLEARVQALEDAITAPKR